MADRGLGREPPRIIERIHPDDTRYAGRLFVEVFAHKKVALTDHMMRALHAGESDAKNQAMEMVGNLDAPGNEFRIAADVAAAMVGLISHRQFLAELINVNQLAVANGNRIAISYASPPFWFPDDITLTEGADEILSKRLLAASQDNPHVFSAIGNICHWMLYAWREHDAFNKFLGLFIPIEIMLDAYTMPLETVIKARADSIRRLVRTHASDDRDELLDFLNELTTKMSPTLFARFELMARTAGMSGWEDDVLAFRQFNRVRNKLLHEGNATIRLDAKLTNAELNTSAIRLEEMVERYANYTIFGGYPD